MRCIPAPRASPVTTPDPPAETVVDRPVRGRTVTPRTLSTNADRRSDDARHRKRDRVQRSARRPRTNTERRLHGTRPSAGCRGCDSRYAWAGSGATRPAPTQSADATRRGRRGQGDGRSRAGPRTPGGLRKALAPGDALRRVHRRGAGRSDTNPQASIRLHCRRRVDRGAGRSVSRVAMGRWCDQGRHEAPRKCPDAPARAHRRRHDHRPIQDRTHPTPRADPREPSGADGEPPQPQWNHPGDGKRERRAR